MPSYQHLKGILVTLSRPHREQRVVVPVKAVPGHAPPPSEKIRRDRVTILPLPCPT